MNCTEDRKRERRGRKKNIVYKVYLVFLQKGIALSIRTPDHKYFFFFNFQKFKRLFNLLYKLVWWIIFYVDEGQVMSSWILEISS